MRDGYGDSDEIVEVSLKDLKELLDRAEAFGFGKGQGNPAYRGLNVWENTRDVWIERFLQCSNKHKDFTCQILGKHTEHGFLSGSGWFLE